MSELVDDRGRKVMRTAQELYEYYLTFDGDIKEHLPYLRYLASQCQHITEFGTRAGISTAAFLAGSPQRLVTYDVNQHEFVHQLSNLAKAECKTRFDFIQGDVLTADIEETDLLFIDTWHVYEQLRAELKRHAHKVRKAIVLHDTETFGQSGEHIGHKGLMPAVAEFLERGTFKMKKHFKNCNGLTVLERVKPESESQTTVTYQPAKVFLGFPFLEKFCGQVIDKYDDLVDPNGEDCAAKFWCGGSFAARNFNQLWAAALNSRNLGWTHFAMCHSDVRPDGYFLSTMLYEMRKHNCDLLSVVLRIKVDNGLTSTAICHKETGEVRRLVRKEVNAIPHQTFDATMAGFPDYNLLASTGLWICDFTKPWVEQVWFEVRDRITKNAQGIYGTETVSEDWAFSHILHKMGLKIMATKAVPCGHWGVKEYRLEDDDNTELNVDNQPSTKFGDWDNWPKPGGI